MITFLDDVIGRSAHWSRLWLIITAVVAVIMPFLPSGNGLLDASTAPAASGKLLDDRNCVRVYADAPDSRLSSDRLAKLIVKYFPQQIGKREERSTVINTTLKRNKDLLCGESSTEDSESLCFKDGERKFCLPINQ